MAKVTPSINFSTSMFLEILTVEAHIRQREFSFVWGMSKWSSMVVTRSLVSSIFSHVL